MIDIKRYSISWKAYEHDSYRTANVYASSEDEAIKAVQKTEQRKMMYISVACAENVVVGKVFDKYGGKSKALNFRIKTGD